MFQPIRSRFAVERNRVRYAWVVTATYALLMSNWLLGHLRFTSPVLNSLTLVAALLLPFLAAALLFPLRGPGKISGFIALALLSLVSLPLLGMTVLLVLPSELPADVDPSCELVRSLPVEGPAIRVYQTNGGAMSSYGILVQQERTVLPGLVWATRLSGWYPADDVSIAVLDRRHIRCSYPPYDDRSATPRVEIVRTQWAIAKPSAP